MKCLIIYYDNYGVCSNGATEKAKPLISFAKTFYDDVFTISTFKWKKRIFNIVHAIKKQIKKVDSVFIILSEKGVMTVSKLIGRYCRKHNINLYYFMVGIGPIVREIGRKKTNADVTKYLQTPKDWVVSNTKFSKRIRTFTRVFVETNTIKMFCDYCYKTKNVVVLPNYRKDAFSKNALPEISNSVCTFLYFARITECKGIFQLLDAVEILNKKGLVFKLNIYGDFEPDAADFRQRLLPSNVNYMGSMSDDKSAVLSTHNCLVFPSTWVEGMPGSILESQLSYLPIISSHFTFSDEMIVEEKTGWILESVNPNCIASLMEHFISSVFNQNVENIMRKNAFDFAKRYLQSSCESILRKELKNE